MYPLQCCFYSVIKVIFEAVVGDETGGDIAIDDYIVVEGSCPPQGWYTLNVTSNLIYS